jgi:hypothetical protein
VRETVEKYMGPLSIVVCLGTCPELLRLRSCFNRKMIGRTSRKSYAWHSLRCLEVHGLVGCIRAQAGAPTLRCPFSTTIMSTAPSTSTSQSNFTSIFNAALESYKRKTKKDLPSHPLLPSLQSCESPEAVLTVLRDQVPAFSGSQNCDEGLTKWVSPTVNVLYSFSGTIGQGVGLVTIKGFLSSEFLP